MSAPSRTIIRDRSKRKVAFSLANRQSRRYPDWEWRVGLSFDTHIALDFDRGGISFDSLRIIAMELSQLTQSDVGIFDSGNGFWLVSKNTLEKERWLGIYNHALKHYADEGLDVIHAELSIKYGKTTLRISPKNGKQNKLLEVIEYARRMV